MKGSDVSYDLANYPLSINFLKVLAAVLLISFFVHLLVHKPTSLRTSFTMWSSWLILLLGPLTIISVITLGIDAGWDAQKPFQYIWSPGKVAPNYTSFTVVWHAQLVLGLLGLLFTTIPAVVLVRASRENKKRVQNGLPKLPITSYLGH